MDLPRAQFLQDLCWHGRLPTLIGTCDVGHLEERPACRPAAEELVELSSHDQASGLHDEGDAGLAKEHENSLEPPLDVNRTAAAKALPVLLDERPEDELRADGNAVQLEHYTLSDCLGMLVEGQLLDPLEERLDCLGLRLDGEIVVVDRRDECGLVLELRLGLGPEFGLGLGVGLEEDITLVLGRLALRGLVLAEPVPAGEGGASLDRRPVRAVPLIDLVVVVSVLVVD
mmetsp:Transcript_38134/g.91271  ORF Transcript_38134/g.91271 Transcript_38134/m.91271 type:complete len:229 (-) Transcript_38134:978-1664(-)